MGEYDGLVRPIDEHSDKATRSMYRKLRAVNNEIKRVNEGLSIHAFGVVKSVRDLNQARSLNKGLQHDIGYIVDSFTETIRDCFERSYEDAITALEKYCNRDGAAYLRQARAVAEQGELGKAVDNLRKASQGFRRLKYGIITGMIGLPDAVREGISVIAYQKMIPLQLSIASDLENWGPENTRHKTRGPENLNEAMCAADFLGLSISKQVSEIVGRVSEAYPHSFDEDDVGEHVYINNYEGVVGKDLDNNVVLIARTSPFALTVYSTQEGLSVVPMGMELETKKFRADTEAHYLDDQDYEHFASQLEQEEQRTGVSRIVLDDFDTHSVGIRETL